MPHAQANRRVEGLAVAALVALLVGVHGMWGGAYDTVVRAELGIVVWWLVLLGVLTGVLPRGRVGAPGVAILVGLAAVALVTTLSLLWTSSAEKTTVEVARVVEYLGVLVLLLLAVRRETVHAALAGLALACAFVCAAALITRLAPGAFADAARDAFGTNRLSAPLNYWNGVAAWGAITTTLLVGIASSGGLRWRGVALAFVPLAVVVTYLTYSRAGVIGTAIGVVALLLLSTRRLALAANLLLAAGGAVVSVLVVRGTPAIADGTGSAGASTVAITVVASGLVVGVLSALGASRLPQLRRPSRRVRTGVWAVAAVVLVVLGVAVGPGLADRASDSFNRDTPASSDTDPTARLTSLGGNRRFLFPSAVAAGDTEPLHGIGGGTFEYWWNTDARNQEYVRDAHNLYLETWAEYGALGVVALLLLILAALAAAWRARGRAGDGIVVAAAAALLVYAFHAGVDWMWELSAVTVVALVLLATLAAGATVPKPRSATRRRIAARAVVAVVAVLAVLVQLPQAVSISDVRESQAAVRAGDLPTASAEAQDAVASSPWSSSPFLQRALVAEAAGDLRKADADLVLAERRDERNWRIPLLRARILAKQGRPRAAIRSFVRARSLRPLSPLFRQDR